MKFFAVVALAATALAASTGLDARTECKPPSYACKHDNSGWLVCNVDGTYLDGGKCPKGTTCKPINNLPYCV